MTALPYTQDVARCFADQIGSGGLPRDGFDRLLASVAGGIGALRQSDLPLLQLPAATADLAPIEDLAQRLRAECKTVILLGTGGSSLGGQTLVALADRGFGPRPGAPRLCFLDNIDPDTFAALDAAIDPAGAAIVAISKSGSTAETLTQLLTLLPRFRGRPLVAITEPTDNPLRRLAQAQHATILDHDPKVGGRYSALSIVGLLPALLAGLDARAVRAGARAVLEATLSAGAPVEAPPAVGAALAVAASEAGLPINVLMPYADRLALFGFWYRQLWAESLGKDGKGTTPVRALGTVDQHSQLQLYLAGPRDKLFTLITAPSAGQGARIAAADPALAYLDGRTLGDLLDAEARATFETLLRNGRPTRLLRLDAIDERALGALMMHFMLETILAAHLLEVDPFDQPAVEEGKVLARDYLGRM